VPTTVALAALTIDLDIQPRHRGLDSAHADDIAAAVAAGADMPPVRVFRTPDGRHVLSRGFHRCEGYARAGKKKIPAEVIDGTAEDAALDAAASVPEHSTLKFTNEDKRRAVANVLRLKADWSDRRVAEWVGVGHQLVADVRRTTGQVDESSTSERTGKDGKVYPVAAKGGGRGAAGSPPAAGESREDGPADTPPGRGGSEPAARKPAPDAPAVPEPPAPPDPAAAFADRLAGICRALDAAKRDVQEVAAIPVYGGHVHAESVAYQIEAARKALWQSRPTDPCNCVRGGKPAAPACRACLGTGVAPASRVLQGGR
jgi:hypothetical protein